MNGGWLWRSFRQTRVAGGAGRVSKYAAAADRHGRRHRAGQRGAAAALSVAPCLYAYAIFSRLNCGRKAGTSGHGLSAHSYFGRAPRESRRAVGAPQRNRSDKPRILEAFNRAYRRTGCRFYMFTTFTGPRRQVPVACPGPKAASIPLSRTTRFMLTEEGAPYVRR